MCWRVPNVIHVCTRQPKVKIYKPSQAEACATLNWVVAQVSTCEIVK